MKMIPVYILEKGTKLPEKGDFYIISKNGIFLHKDTGFLEAVVKVDKISFLEQIKPEMVLKLPKIPLEIMVRSLLFFRRVYQYYRTEAVLLLHYSESNESYYLHCPAQKVFDSRVIYNLRERFDGYQLIGTVHSHGRSTAFHSVIDKDNEENFDGLHITIGNLNMPYFTIAVSVVINNNRFKMVFSEIIDGVKKVDYAPRDRFLSCIFELSGKKAKKKLQFYEIVFPDGKDYRSYPISKQWLPNVSK